MPLNRNTLMRIRTIDACLCRRQRQWTIEDLRQTCEDALNEYEGIKSVSLRTVQRDIELMRSEKLGYNAPIVVREKKFYEYDDPDFSITQLPLSTTDLEELSSAMEIIRHYNSFQCIGGQDDILARLEDKIQSQMSRRQIVFIETNRQLKGLNFLGPLYDCISKKNAVIIDYHSFHSRETSFKLSPYLLKEFNNRWFLVSYSKKRKNIQICALDRIVAVKADRKENYIENTFFKPEEFLSEMVGVTRDLNSKKSKIVLKVDSEQAPYVLTKPLHCSQQLLRTEEDGSIVISLDVIHNLELERLILGYGYHIEVITPIVLRKRISQNILAAAAMYQTNDLNHQKSSV